MRRLTRITTLTMAVLLTVVIGTVSVNAATDSGTFGKNGDNLTWEYDDQTKTLTISGTGEMEDWPAGYATPWGSYQMEITTVVINDGVTNIGKEAFSNYHALTSVTLPNSVTDIRFHGFQGSENLASIDLPDNLTTIGGAAFYGCHALTDVTIPDSVTTMEDSVFANCGNLTNVVIGKNVKSIDYQTFYHTNIASIEIPKSVKAIYTQAFARTKIQEITIPRSVTELGGGIFNDCDNLTTIIYEGTEEQWNTLTNGVRLGVDLSKVNVKIETKWYVTYDLNGGTGKNGFEPQEIMVDDGFESEVPNWDELQDVIETPAGKVYAGVEINGKKVEVGEIFKVTEDVEIKLLWEDKYKILEGSDQTYTIDSNEDIVIKASGGLDVLAGIKFDDVTLTEGTDYEVESGSTILTLKSSFLNKQSAGDHTVEFAYTDGSASTKLAVAEANVPEEEDDSDDSITPGDDSDTTGDDDASKGQGESKKADSSGKNKVAPATGDNNYDMMLLTTLVLSSLGLLLVLIKFIYKV